MKKKMGKTIMWFRKDFRLADNRAFQALIQQVNPAEIICIFQLNPVQFLTGTFNHDSFFLSLQTFYTQIKKQGIPLHFIAGDCEQSFMQLKQVFPEWDQIFFNQDESGFGKQRDQVMLRFFKQHKIQVYAFQDSHLHGVEEIKKATGEAYQMFTPYYKKWIQLPKPSVEREYLPLKTLKQYDNELFTAGYQSYEQVLQQVNLPFPYECGEQVATSYLENFIKNHLHSYDYTRDYPALNQTSRLSSFLRTGEISIRKVWQAVLAEPDSDGRQTFMKELCWRDFYHMIYFYYPNQANQEIKEKYRQLVWHGDSTFFQCWKKGKTGYPIVDAAMRQLNQTGWMHNRLRMIVASFLTKDLLTDWRLGEQYFKEKLIDYDPASNIGGWQWAASTGTDAVPYFRIFNPRRQSAKFDSDGRFIRQFLPELINVPNEYIHEPAKMPKTLQQSLKTVIGQDYPHPIVSHSQMRERTLAFYQNQTHETE